MSVSRYIFVWDRGIQALSINMAFLSDKMSPGMCLGTSGAYFKGLRTQSHRSASHSSLHEVQGRTKAHTAYVVNETEILRVYLGC